MGRQWQQPRECFFAEVALRDSNHNCDVYVCVMPLSIHLPADCYAAVSHIRQGSMLAPRSRRSSAAHEQESL
jgi:hypothetical protein